MANVSHCEEVLDPLRKVCDVLVEPADVDRLSQCVNEFDVYLASLLVQLHGGQLSSATRLKAVAAASTG